MTGRVASVAARPTAAVGRAAVRPLEVAAFGAIVALAAVARFWSLASRGTWNADQGHDMLVLTALVQRGELPLLGPPTSIGDFHHGVAYYYLLVPSALLGGGDPTAVVAEIALSGVLAVALVYLLARQLGGVVAGIVAAGLLAVSAAAIDESTFIWNPNLIAFTSAATYLAVVVAFRSGRARWWLAAFVGTILTMHCHVLGAALLPAVGGAWLWDVRRRRRTASGEADPAALGRLAWVGVAGLALLALSYVPLLVHELGTGWSELHAAIAFVSAGGGSSSIALPSRLLIVLARVLSWPLVGLVTDAPVPAILSAVGVAVAAAWLVRRPGRSGAAPIRFLVATLAWGALALGLGAASLATVVPGLPVDHYHAFLDPIVATIVGVAVARLVGPAIRQAAGARGRRAVVGPPRHRSADRAGTAGGPVRLLSAVAAVAAVAALVAWNVAHWPPAVSPDGGWPAVQGAAARVAGEVDPGPRLAIVSVPPFKPADTYVFPLERLGIGVDDVTRATSMADGSFAAAALPSQVVVACDDLFREAIGAACGGPAEDTRLSGSGLALVDRFEAAPGRWLSVYRRPR